VRASVHFRFYDLAECWLRVLPAVLGGTGKELQPGMPVELIETPVLVRMLSSVGLAKLG